MEGAAEGNHLAAAVRQGDGAEVIALEQRLAVIQHKAAVRENTIGDVGLLELEELLVGLQAEEDAHGHGAVLRGQVGQCAVCVVARTVEAVSGLNKGRSIEVPDLLRTVDLLHLDIVIVRVGIAHAQLAVVVAVAPKYITVFDIELVVSSKHMIVALDREGIFQAASVISIQGLSFLSRKATAISIILRNSADAVDEQHRCGAEVLSRAVQLAAFCQKYGVLVTDNHVHDLFRDIHLYNLTAIGGGAVTQLATTVVPPCPDGAVLLQRVVTAKTSGIVIISLDHLHAGHGLTIIEFAGGFGTIHIVILQHTTGKDVDAGLIKVGHSKVIYVGKIQLLGRLISATPAPEGAVAEPGIIRITITIIIEILYVLHLRILRRIRDADHQLGGQLGAHKGRAKGGRAVLVLDELAVGGHLADVRVGGLPCDVPLCGGGRGDGQLQVVVRLLHGGDVDALLKGNALRRLHHGDGDGCGEVLAHGGAGGDDGGAHADGVYGAVPIHGGYILIGALVDHAGAGGVRGGEHRRQLLGAAHGQAEGVLVEGQALQRHTVGHMDGHVLIHGAVGIADAHQGAAGGHGGDEAGAADGDNALIQGGVLQVGHQRRLHGRHLRQQLLCHAGVQGDLGFGQGDVGDGGVGERNNIVRARPCREIFCRRIIFSGKSRQIFPTYVLGKPLHHGFLYLKITPRRNSGVDGARILITVTDRYTANAVGVDSSRGVAADIAAVFVQVVVVSVEDAVGVFVILAQTDRAVHENATVAVCIH